MGMSILISQEKNKHEVIIIKMRSFSNIIDAIEDGSIPFDKESICKVLREIQQCLENLDYEVRYNREPRHRCYGGY